MLYDAGHCRKILFLKYFFGVLFVSFILYIYHVACHDVINCIVFCCFASYFDILYILLRGIIFDYIVFFI